MSPRSYLFSLRRYFLSAGNVALAFFIAAAATAQEAADDGPVGDRSRGRIATWDEALSVDADAGWVGSVEDSATSRRRVDATALQERIRQLAREVSQLHERISRLRDEGEEEEAARFEQALTSRMEFLGRLAVQAANMVEVDEEPSEEVMRQQALAALRMAELAAQREQQLAQMGARRSQERERAERLRSLPPLEDAQTVLFQLRHVSADQVAKILNELFGPEVIRVATYGEGTLIVSVVDDVREQVNDLISSIDRPAQTDEPQHDPAANEMGRGDGDARATAVSLLVRVFWLADNLPAGEGQAADRYLPGAVTGALEQLGLESPRIVTQTVNSLAVAPSVAEAASFTTSTSVASQGLMMTQLNCEGTATLRDDDRVALQLQIALDGQVGCRVGGTLELPLGHFVVLGTANGVVAKPVEAEGEDGGGFDGGGRGGFDGGRGGRGVGGRGGFSGGRGGGGIYDAASTPDVAYEQSRLAFVVQVIENKTYSAEE